LSFNGAEEQADGDIRAGVVSCARCYEYQIVEGILDLRVELDDVVANEIAGWDEMYAHKPEEQRPEWLLALPYLTPELESNEIFCQIWKRNGDIFFQAVDALDLRDCAREDRKGKKVLEIGASTCWASAYFASLGYDAVALDITRKKYYGLEAGGIWMEAQGSYFERVLCDMHHLPFIPSTFDIVFLCNTAHHSSNIRRLFAEAARVLKPDGFVLDIIEPLCRLFKRDNVCNREVDLGINEHIYSVFEYTHAIKQAGLKHELFLERHLGSAKDGLAEYKREKANSPNPIKRFIKGFIYWRFIPQRVRIFCSMFTDQLSTFNVIARK